MLDSAFRRRGRLRHDPITKRVPVRRALPGAGTLLAAAVVACSGSGELPTTTEPETGVPAPAASAWTRFRGPNGSGVTVASGLPARFGAGQNVVWSTPLPPGHASPVIGAGRVFVTAFENEELFTYALDAETGEVAWRRGAPRARREQLDKRNSPAAPTPATDGEAVYVFFGEYGLVAYDVDGEERWSLPLGPFDNAYGMGSSPIVAGDLVVLVCDQSTGSFLIAVDRRDGSVRYRIARPEARTGHSTPIVWSPPGQPAQLLVPGSFRLTAYSLSTGDSLWWVSGLAFEMKATPVLGDSGDTVFIHGTSASSFEDSYGRAIPPFEEVRDHDTDSDGRFAREEIPDELARRWMGLIDLDKDGALDPDEWEYYRAARASRGGLYAFRTGGEGDMTTASFMWHQDRAIPQLPSPLLYEDVLYIIDDGGILSLFEPPTGELLDRGRLPEALDSYYASPVAADGKVYLASETGKVVALRAGRDIDVLAVNDLDDLIYATPAIDNDRIYVRTRNTLYAFGELGARAGIAGQAPDRESHPDAVDSSVTGH